MTGEEFFGLSSQGVEDLSVGRAFAVGFPDVRFQGEVYREGVYMGCGDNAIGEG